MSNSLHAPFKLTPREIREYDERLESVRTMLARSPYLTKAHFSNYYGYRHAFLVMLEKEHSIKFGKGERQRIKINSDGKVRHEGAN